MVESIWFYFQCLPAVLFSPKVQPGPSVEPHGNKIPTPKSGIDIQRTNHGQNRDQQTLNLKIFHGK